jgi:hypothetical protein
MTFQERQASIMGSSFYPGASNHIPRLHPGQQLRVEREPTNKYDANAVSLYVFNQKLGHLPRGLAAEVAPLIDAGVTVTVHKSRDPRFGTSGVVVVRWETPDQE